jgi:hypothetical protein
MALYRIVKILSPATPFPFRTEQKVFFVWRSLGGMYSTLFDAQQAIRDHSLKAANPFKAKVVEEYYQ